MIAENKFMQKSTPNIGFVSLGCPKNLVDSERILTELRTDGYNIVPSYENVDLVIVNTCGFIDMTGCLRLSLTPYIITHRFPIYLNSHSAAIWQTRRSKQI